MSEETQMPMPEPTTTFAEAVDHLSGIMLTYAKAEDEYELSRAATANAESVRNRAQSQLSVEIRRFVRAFPQLGSMFEGVR